MNDTSEGPWADALLAARMLAIDPGLGGIIVRASAGAVRDAWLADYRAGAAGPIRRLPSGIDDERLLGGLDLAATLAAERPVVSRGILAEADGGSVIVPMAERIDEALAGKLAAVIDTGAVVVERDGLSLRLPARAVFVFLDEGIGDERVPAALVERVAFAVNLDGVTWRDAAPQPTSVIRAKAGTHLLMVPEMGPRFRGDDGGRVSDDGLKLTDVTISDAAIETICGTALAVGADSARAGLMAVRAARAHAALAGRDSVTDGDVLVATRLVLMPRATRLPTPPPPPQQEDEAPPPPEPSEGDTENDDAIDALTDIAVEAIRASLPPDLLAALASGRRVTSGKRSGAGAKRKSAKRGRPAPSRPGVPGAGQRLALVDTLRAAAPWQGLRRPPGTTRVIVRRDDFRIQRFVERAEATTIFAVDASGSAAIARLAEAKGAVELLLAEAYVRRTQVALIAFRGTVAELVLPPTRSLARAKRCLGDLAGGGGTPLADGIAMAVEVARAASAKGRTPFVVVLTDGRANIARDGTASRERATSDALAAARSLAGERIAAAFIDTAPRPRPEGAELAAAMGARYAPLPRGDAAAMAAAVRAFEPVA